MKIVMQSGLLYLVIEYLIDYMIANLIAGDDLYSLKEHGIYDEIVNTFKRNR